MDVTQQKTLGWLGIVRLGLVQASLGGIVVLMTSTLNRVMTAELGLIAMLPGVLLGIQYAVQLSRPRWGYGSDVGGKRTPWILGGMLVLAIGGIGAAASVAVFETSFLSGLIGSILSYIVIGIGAGAAGTNVLALLASQTKPSRKAAAAAIAWTMMIAGFVISTATAAAYLDDFSMLQLVRVVTVISIIGVLISCLAMWRLEQPKVARPVDANSDNKTEDFLIALKAAWDDPQARLFTIFVFISMLGYSAQDLVLEPFAGIIFDFTVAESTRLTSQMHSGALIGMIGTAVIATVFGKSRARFMRTWTIFGCLAAAIAFLGLVMAAAMPSVWPLIPTVFVLGVTLGVFTVAAIGSMMVLASAGEPGREGTRMGLWGASQAIAMGLGALLGTIILDVSRWIIGSAAPAYAIVFATEAVLFVIAAACAALIGRTSADEMDMPIMPSAELVSAE